MDELIARVVAATGVDTDTAAKAVGLVLAFLKKEGPKEEVNDVIGAVPGADALTAAAGQNSSGTFAMLPGGGLMQLAGELTGLGLDMDQMRATGREIFGYAKEKVGEDKVGAIVGAIPGLAGFV